MKISVIVILCLFSVFTFTSGVSHAGYSLEELNAIQRSMSWLETEIEIKQKQIKEESDLKQKALLLEDRNTLEDKFRSTQGLFVSAANDINFDENEQKTDEQKKRNLIDEAQELFAPVIDTLKRVSARPRRIESLKNNIHSLQESVDRINIVAHQLESLKKKKSNSDLLEKLSKVLKKLQQQKEVLDVRLETLKVQLADEMGDKKTLSQTLSEFGSHFFGTLGRNFFYAILTFFVVFTLLLFARKLPIKIRKLDDENLDWLRKPLRAFYLYFSFMLALIGSLGCLYILHDRVLFTFGLVLLLGVVWSIKTFLPRIFGLSALIMNLGPVRENERILWNGIPWLVKVLAPTSILENPSLQGGILKIKASKLLDAYSRRHVKNEPWFPTEKGDFIELNDGTQGEVTLQTPEQVIIKMGGGTTKTFIISDFLSKNPINYSHGFCMAIDFGLDYNIQGKILELPQTFQALLNKKFEKKLSQNEIKNILVEFASAEASSLNLKIFVECDGKIAAQRMKLRRELQAALVSICNELKLDIPFNQMTVHVETPSHPLV